MKNTGKSWACYGLYYTLCKPLVKITTAAQLECTTRQNLTQETPEQLTDKGFKSSKTSLVRRKRLSGHIAKRFICLRLERSSCQYLDGGWFKSKLNIVEFWLMLKQSRFLLSTKRTTARHVIMELVKPRYHNLHKWALCFNDDWRLVAWAMLLRFAISVGCSITSINVFAFELWCSWEVSLKRSTSVALGYVSSNCYAFLMPCKLSECIITRWSSHLF